MDVKKINGYDVHDAEARKLATNAHSNAQLAIDKVNNEVIPVVNRVNTDRNYFYSAINSHAESLTELQQAETRQEETNAKVRYDLDDLKGQCSDLLNDVEVIENRLDNLPTIGEGGEVTSLGWNSITGKPAEYPPESHTHDWSEIENAPATGASTWDEIQGKPEKFPPETHTHNYATMQQVNDAISTALSNIQNASGVSF